MENENGTSKDVKVLTPETIHKMAVDREIAIREINGWIEFKKIGRKKRDEYAENIEQLVDAVEEGVLIVTEKHELKHTLKFPIGNGGTIKELIYKPRIKGSDIDRQTKGIKTNDTGGRVRAYVAALTGVAKGILADMDTEDYSVSQGIAVFFI